jgi:hypothetical protein
LQQAPVYTSNKNKDRLKIMLALTKSDDQLISLALTGSQRSWLRLVKRHEGRIYNYCLRMCGDGSEAMDLMQEVFLTVVKIQCEEVLQQCAHCRQTLALSRELFDLSERWEDQPVPA